MAAKKSDKAHQKPHHDEVPPSKEKETPGSGDAGSRPPPGPDAMLGLWTSWMEQNLGAAREWIGSDKPWWQVGTDELAGSLLAGGVQQFHDILAKDPLLRSVDQMWNANPLREVVPIDWAEITRALRTVWMHSMRKPEQAIAAVAELNLAFWRTAIDVWSEAGKQWMGLAGIETSPGSTPAPRPPPPTSGSRRRNGKTTRSTAPSRSFTCWPRTGC